MRISISERIIIIG